MYCTLEEAYNVPSFEKKRRGGQRGQQMAPISATPAEVEGFMAGSAPMSSKRTYKGETQDMMYYKKNYGLKLPNLEAFEDAPAPKCSTSAQPPVYEFPISEEAKRAHALAQRAAMGEDGPRAPQPPSSAVKPPAMSSGGDVTGYYDEDLEQYLSANEWQETLQPLPTPTPSAAPPAAEPYDPKDSPFAKALKQFSHKAVAPPVPIVVPKGGATAVYQWQWIWDILLFVIAGILVIILCDQLFKLAMATGMSRTTDILAPVLKKLDL